MDEKEWLSRLGRGLFAIWLILTIVWEALWFFTAGRHAAELASVSPGVVLLIGLVVRWGIQDFLGVRGEPMPTNEPCKADHGCASCVICGRWPSALRPAMRCAVNVLPLQEPICGECMKAFGANVTA